MTPPIAHNWHGNIVALAKKAEDFLRHDGRTPGHGQVHPRVIRDYQRRGVVSPPERKGREAIYTQRHALELILARILLAEGWTLGKIAQSFDRMSDSDLVSLIDGSGPSELGEAIHENDRENQNVGFAYHAAFLASQRSTLQQSRRALNLDGNPPAPIAKIHFQLSPWAQLAIDADRIGWLDREQAVELGRIVTAILVARKTNEANPEPRPSRPQRVGQLKGT